MKFLLLLVLFVSITSCGVIDNILGKNEKSKEKVEKTQEKGETPPISQGPS